MTDKQMHNEIMLTANRYEYIGTVKPSTWEISVDTPQGKNIYYDQGEAAADIIEDVTSAAKKYRVPLSSALIWYLDHAGVFQRFQGKNKNTIREQQEFQLDALALRVAHQVADHINNHAYGIASAIGDVHKGVGYPNQYTLEKVITILQASV